MMEWRQFPDNFNEQYRNIPKDRPYETLLTGGYQGTMDTGMGIHRYWVYFPEGMEYSCRHLVILIPGDETVDTFLQRTGWLGIAQREKLLLLMAGSSEDPWQGNEEAAARLNKLDQVRNDRTYMDTQRAFSYFAGYGEGAEYGHRYVAANPAVYASAAFFGRIEMASDELEAEGEKGTAAPDILKKEVPCPVCFVGERELYPEYVFEYWRRANKTEELAYCQGDKTVWLPDMAQTESSVDHQAVARVVWFHAPEAAGGATEVRGEAADGAAGTAAEVWDTFLSKTVRATGILNGDLHAYRTAKQWGLLRREIQVDGVTRHWYEYVPKRLSVLADERVPLVVFFHGGSASALSGLYSHEWVLAAKERGFILALPTGTMRRQDTMMPHPAWNASRQDDHMDDEKMIRMMTADIQSRYPVDAGRIYACGHSMGAAMTQRAALAMPDLFAAAASNSGVVTGGFMGDFDTPGVREDVKIPIWIQMGENDVGGGTLLNNPKAARTVHYWVSRYQLPDEEQPCHWRTGRYLNKEWRNMEGVPMVRYTTTLEKPHAITPQDPWFYYDEFFCRFSRGEDGELYYQGKAVK